jgi:hypothetical protein
MPSAKRARISKLDKQLPDTALMKDTYISEASSGFFGLPLEIRNAIYDLLWIDQKTIVVAQRHSKLDITAHFQSTGCGKRFGRNRFLKENDKQLPMWLLVNKLSLREATAQFTRNSHFILRPLPTSKLYRPLPPTTIMLPGLARSISLPDMSLQSPTMPIRGRFLPNNGKVQSITIPFSSGDSTWLENLADYLHKQNRVERLHLALQYPVLSFTYRPQQVKVDLAPIQRLLEVLENLQTIEVEFYHQERGMGFGSAPKGIVVEQELQDEVRNVVWSAWGTDVKVKSEMSRVLPRGFGGSGGFGRFSQMMYRPSKSRFTKSGSGEGRCEE